MKIYYNRSFEGFYGVGTSAVVVAETPEEAAGMLSIELTDKGLKGDVRVCDMVLIDTSKPLVIILKQLSLILLTILFLQMRKISTLILIGMVIRLLLQYLTMAMVWIMSS